MTGLTNKPDTPRSELSRYGDKLSSLSSFLVANPAKWSLFYLFSPFKQSVIFPKRLEEHQKATFPQVPSKFLEL